ncbi:unnamed protein product [Symbiodinium natans]|uniref:Uncharacterized protein n=1 Tax=Symbiodinium natans TaxID=878477 RepID=A0A812NRB3_9DINO|nr:unnamed protein product [Symbiodinium natans]
MRSAGSQSLEVPEEVTQHFRTSAKVLSYREGILQGFVPDKVSTRGMLCAARKKHPANLPIWNKQNVRPPPPGSPTPQGQQMLARGGTQRQDIEFLFRELLELWSPLGASRSCSKVDPLVPGVDGARHVVPHLAC